MLDATYSPCTVVGPCSLGSRPSAPSEAVNHVQPPFGSPRQRRRCVRVGVGVGVGVCDLRGIGRSRVSSTSHGHRGYRGCPAEIQSEIHQRRSRVYVTTGEHIVGSVNPPNLVNWLFDISCGRSERPSALKSSSSSPGGQNILRKILPLWCLPVPPYLLPINDWFLP